MTCRLLRMRLHERLRMRPALALLASLFALDAAAQPAPGIAAVERMRRTYDGTWYQTLTFIQQTIVSRAGGKPDTTTWYESVSGARLRIDIGDPSLGNGVLYTADSAIVVRGGAVARRTGNGNPFLPLIMGVYVQPVAETVRQLRLFGFDLAKATTGTWEGRPVTIVGAASGSDTASAQFWIDDERQVVVRVRGAARGTGGADVHIGGYVRAGGGWLGTRVSIVGPTVSQIEEYSDWKVDVPLSEDLFDPAKWSTAPHWLHKR